MKILLLTVSMCFGAEAFGAEARNPMEVALGGNCAVRTEAQMASAYSAGLLTLTGQQLFGFTQNWRSGLGLRLSRSTVFESAHRWVDAFVGSFFSARIPDVLSVHFVITGRQVLVLSKNTRSGSMTIYPIENSVFTPVVAIFDEFICSSNKAAAQHAQLPTKLATSFATVLEVQEDEFVDPTIKTDVAFRFYKQIGAATNEDLTDFKTNADHYYRLAVTSRALYLAGLNEALQYSSAPNSTTQTLDKLDVAKAALEAPSKADQEDVKRVVELLNRSEAKWDAPLTSTVSSPETQRFIQDLTKQSMIWAKNFDSPVIKDALRQQNLPGPGLY